MIAPTAPEAAAFSPFSWNEQAPRWIRAMLPAQSEVHAFHQPRHVAGIGL
jgi:hypothetical protein